MMKRLVHTGSTLRPRSAAEKAVIAEALRDKVWPLLDEGRCKPIIDSTFPLDEADKAHRADGGLGAFRQDRADGLRWRATG